MQARTTVIESTHRPGAPSTARLPTRGTSAREVSTKESDTPDRMAAGGKGTGRYIAGCHTHQHKGADRGLKTNLFSDRVRTRRARKGQAEAQVIGITPHSSPARGLRTSANVGASRHDKAGAFGRGGIRSHRQGATGGLPAERRALAARSSRQALHSQWSIQSCRLDSNAQLGCLKTSQKKTSLSIHSYLFCSQSIQASARRGHDIALAIGRYTHTSSANVSRSDTGTTRYSFCSCLRRIGEGLRHHRPLSQYAPRDIGPQQLASDSGGLFDQRALIRWNLTFAVPPKAHRLGCNAQRLSQCCSTTGHVDCHLNLVHTANSTLVERTNLQVCLRKFLQMFKFAATWL